MERVQKEHVEKGWPWSGVAPPAYIPPGRFEVQVCYISHLCFSLTYLIQYILLQDTHHLLALGLHRHILVFFYVYLASPRRRRR